MISDMGMDFTILIRVFFDEVKQIKKARRSADSEADIAQSIVGRSEKTPIVSKASKHKKFYSLGSRLFGLVGFYCVQSTIDAKGALFQSKS
ncbi:hypothetical protein AMTR_s00065p00064490 [Amborella trichopoda]|uniref:Uncharacterized protein n=1 Tax=Amborella trichopoda TaxID=13333 RepID=U5DAU1_AMBTC|nr:hypothetical protein AMTR_s00065p00064490 [Amborella trichopoda]